MGGFTGSFHAIGCGTISRGTPCLSSVSGRRTGRGMVLCLYMGHLIWYERRWYQVHGLHLMWFHATRNSASLQLNYTHVSRIQLYSSTSILTSYIQYMVFIRLGGSFTHVSSFTSIGEDLKFGQSFSSLFEKSATLFYTCVGIWAATIGAGSNGVLE